MARWKALLLSRRALLVLLTLAIIGAGIAWKLLRTDDSAARYLTAEVVRGSIEENVTALGTLQPLKFVDVGTQVTGQLKKLHIDIGSRVDQGQLLAEIDPIVLSSRVEGTRATIRNLTAQLAERRTQLELTRLQHERNRVLFEADATSRDAFEQSVAAEKSAAAQVDSLRAQIDQAQSTLTSDEANLRYTKVYAPITGTVVTLTAREGQTLVASQQAPVILRIANLRTMTVTTQVSEADVPKIRLDMPVYFMTLGQPERRWYGKVRQILPTPEVVNNVVLYNVLFDVENDDGALQLQMSAQAYFVLSRADDVLIAPAAALQTSAGRSREKGKRDPAAKKTAAATVEPQQSGAAAKKADESAQAETAAKKADSAAAQPGKRGAARTDAEKNIAAGETQAKSDAAQREGRKGGRGRADGKGRQRTTTVRVLVDGRVEERQVVVGVTNRIQAEIVSGLNEGDLVIIGVSESKDKGKAPARPAAKMGKL